MLTGIVVIPLTFSILVSMLIIEIILILIFGTSYIIPKWFDEREEGIALSMKTIAIFIGIVVTSIIILLIWLMATGILVIPLTLSILIPILIIEVVSILISGVLYILPKWREERERGIVSKKHMIPEEFVYKEERLSLIHI